MNDQRIETSQRTWNMIARSFDTTRKKPWEQCQDFIKSFKKDSITLDIACGNARQLIPSAQYSKKTIGLDISQQLLRISQQKIKEQKIKNISLIKADAVNIPLESDTFDNILYIAALHTISGRENRIKSLKETKRILKSDGKALISVWSRWQDKFRTNFIKEKSVKNSKQEYGDIEIFWRQHGLNIPRFYHLYSKTEFMEDIKKAGLKIIDFKEVNLKSKKYPDNFFAVVSK